MRNWVAALTLILIVPLGLLLATHGPNKLTSAQLTSEPNKTMPSERSPSVQYTAGVKGWVDDPLISPIVLTELAEVRPISMTVDFTHGSHASFHPHGEQVCASGCAASRHPTETLTETQFVSLLLEYADEPLDDAGPAQDALLYYGRQASRRLATGATGRLDPLHAAVLKHELGRDHAEIEIRVVDALDHVRASLPATNVPLDRRHEFELDTHQLQPMIASGTVKRVGRNFLWTRL